ncbi:MAG: DNA polymerase I [bacterium]|nr:DNA polymerase I [bacterium]
MKLLAIDGNSIINRSFYGIKLLTTKDGRYTNAIFGFLNILNRLIETEKPDGIVAAFDLRTKTFRHKKYDKYKAGRKGMPDELAEQFEPLKKILTHLGCICIEKEGFEADDILGTLSKIFSSQGNCCVIATGDRDSLQLVSDSTKVLLSTTKAGRPEIVTFDTQAVFDKYGVKPKSLIEIKALQGDASDNIPGVSGIGEKTAQDLIVRFENIDNIYENLERLDIKDSLRTKLENGREFAFLSRELGEIFCDVDIPQNPDNYVLNPQNTEKLSEILFDLELFSFAKKLGLEQSESSEKKSLETITPIYDFKQAATLAKQTGKCSLFIENDSLFFSSGLSAGVFPLCVDSLRNLFSDPKTEKRVYDAKNICKWCATNNISIENISFDSMLAAYLINPSSSSYDLQRLASEYSVPLREVSGSESDDIKKAVLHYDICEVLYEKLNHSQQLPLLCDIEIPLARVLADMESVGFLVDSEGIKKYGDKLNQRIESLKQTIWQEVGYEFNLNSPKQLGLALFEKLGLPCKKKTKSGYSTNAEVLEELKFEHPCVEKLLEYRQLSKLKSTYCDGLLAAVGPGGRIHSTLNQTETKTGRISSLEPNLQNIPVKKEEGRQLRRYFKAQDGFVLCDADYSQIELRVLADIAEDSVMIDAFNSDVDIHTVTASQVFNMPANLVTPLMRSRAKAVNFGIVYGIGAFSLSKDIGVSRKDADQYIKGYLSTYSGVDRYMKQVVEKAKEDGFVSTRFNRRRQLPELRSSNAMLRAFGERVARNMPIQGTAADIIKIAMIRVYNRLRHELPEAKLILQVHDELIVEAPQEKAELACKILKEEMETAVNLQVPLTVDVNFGKTWYDAKGD